MKHETFLSIYFLILVQILDSLKAYNDGLQIITISRDKELNRSATQFNNLYEILKNSSVQGQKIKIGILQKDKNEGPMIEEWSSFLSSHLEEYETIDLASSISSLLAIKDSEELVEIFHNGIY